MREVGNKLSLGEVAFNRILHCPVDFLNLAVGRNGIHRTEHLGNVHHMTGIEEGDFFLPPFLTVLAAKVLGTVFLEGVKQDFLLHVH